MAGTVTKSIRDQFKEQQKRLRVIQNRQKKIEAELAVLEDQKTKFMTLLEQAYADTDQEQMKALGKKTKEIKNALEELYQELEELMKEAEETIN